MLGEQIKILSLDGVWEKRGRQQTNIQVASYIVYWEVISSKGKKEQGKESWCREGSFQ